MHKSYNTILLFCIIFCSIDIFSQSYSDYITCNSINYFENNKTEFIEDSCWYWEKLDFPDQDGIKQLIADSSGGLIAVVNRTDYWNSKFYHSTDKGNTWEMTGEHRVYDCCDIKGRNYIFGRGPRVSAHAGESVVRSNDYGKTWKIVEDGHYASDIYAFSSNRMGYLYVLYHYVGEDSYNLLYSLNYGNNWISSSVYWSYNWEISEIFRFIVDDSSHFLLSRNNCLYITKDDGLSWDSLLVISENDYIRSIAVNSRSHLFVNCDSSGFFRSIDGGQNWENIQMPDSSISSIQFTHGDTIIVSTTERGVFTSFDNGDSWIERNYGLSDLNIRIVAIDRSDNIYLVNKDGLYRNTALWVNPIVEKSSIPYKFILQQNYPNPFNVSTTIRFTLPNEEKVTVSIFDIRGQFLCNLHIGRLNKGMHKFVWNASSMSSGIYFYCVQIGNRTYSQKMLLIK